MQRTRFRIGGLSAEVIQQAVASLGDAATIEKHVPDKEKRLGLDTPEFTVHASDTAIATLLREHGVVAVKSSSGTKG